MQPTYCMLNPMNTDQKRLILLIYCPDQPGLVAAVTAFIAKYQGNVIHLDQHVDREENVFFMRIEIQENSLTISKLEFESAFEQVATTFQMHWSLEESNRPLRMAIFVSRESHCLYDVLSRVQSNEWNVEIPLIISNHEDLAPIAHTFGINYHVLPITKDNKQEQEAKELDLLNNHTIDVIVLARYMQIISNEFIAHYPNRIINIHHSFLPAFPGARPYHSAYERGVKLIGATSHYVTEELDNGPIISQDIIRVGHRDSLKDFIRKGKDVEKIVLARAIWWHLQHKTLVYNNKTVIFE